ncbi:MAG: hypothetical protein H7Y00_01440 [Fimbriimonadaceae bacterium]|nr:hypothetical protein [Chitinophagales bacterium]
MEPLKPYIWVNENANPKVVTVMVNCTTANGNFDLHFLSSQDDLNNHKQLIVKYQLMAGSGGITSRDFILNAANNYTNQDKIKIEVYSSGNNPVLKGMAIALLNINGFSANPNKPMCWIKNNPVNNTKEIFFRVNQLTEQIPVNPSTIQQIPNLNKLILYYDMNGGAGGDCERSYNLSAYSDYNLVEIQIRNNALTKGKGTTDQDSADNP